MFKYSNKTILYKIKMCTYLYFKSITINLQQIRLGLLEFFLVSSGFRCLLRSYFFRFRLTLFSNVKFCENLYKLPTFLLFIYEQVSTMLIVRRQKEYKQILDKVKNVTNKRCSESKIVITIPNQYILTGYKFIESKKNVLTWKNVLKYHQLNYSVN